MTAPSSSRRRPSPGWAERMDATRRELAQAAADLFIRRGYGDTSVDEIAAAAGVSRRTFFRYYSTKEDVFLQPTLGEVTEFLAQLETAPLSGDPVADVAATMDRAVHDRTAHLEDALALYRSVRASPELRGAVRSFTIAFEDGIAAWYTRHYDNSRGDPDAVHVRVFASCMVAVREAALARWAQRPEIPLTDHLAQGWEALRAVNDGH